MSTTQTKTTTQPSALQKGDQPANPHTRENRQLSTKRNHQRGPAARDERKKLASSYVQRQLKPAEKDGAGGFVLPRFSNVYEYLRYADEEGRPIFEREGKGKPQQSKRKKVKGRDLVGSFTVTHEQRGRVQAKEERSRDQARAKAKNSDGSKHKEIVAGSTKIPHRDDERSAHDVEDHDTPTVKRLVDTHAGRWPALARQAHDRMSCGMDWDAAQPPGPTVLKRASPTDAMSKSATDSKESSSQVKTGLSAGAPVLQSIAGAPFQAYHTSQVPYMSYTIGSGGEEKQVPVSEPDVGCPSAASDAEQAPQRAPKGNRIQTPTSDFDRPRQVGCQSPTDKTYQDGARGIGECHGVDVFAKKNDGSLNSGSDCQEDLEEWHDCDSQ